MAFRNCFRRLVLLSSIAVLALSDLMPQLFTISAQWYPQPDYALEISLPAQAIPRRVSVRKGGPNMTFISRSQLTITNPEAAGEFTDIEVRADGENDGVRVRLSIIYRDLKDKESWKNRKEKIIGSWLIGKGESLRPAELTEFGIEPLEIRVSGVKKKVFKPGEGPRVTDETGALEVVTLERTVEYYSLLLRNVSSKNIVALMVYCQGGRGVNGVSFSHKPVIAAGEVYELDHLPDHAVETEGITIRAVVFEDGTYAGNDREAMSFIVKGEGVKIQSPSVLKMIEQALEASDDDIESAFIKLEADLWQIPEAMSKDSAISWLRSKYGPDPYNASKKFVIAGGKEAEVLYEELKGGLYDARNHALAPLGNLKRQIQQEGFLSGEARKKERAEAIRRAMIRLKDDFEKVIAGQ